MGNARSDILLLFFLTRCTAFAIRIYLLLLLVRNGFAFTFTGTGIRLRALSANRQTFTMSQTSVTSKIHKSLDVDADFATQLTFDKVVAVNNFTNFRDFFLGQFVNAATAVDSRFAQMS